MIKNVIIFLAGLGIGGAGGYFLCKRRLENKFNEKWNEEMSRIGKYSREENSEKSVSDIVEPESDRDEMKELRKKEKLETHNTDYTSYYKNGSLEMPEGEVDESLDTDGGLDITINEEADEYHEQNKHREPIAISAEEAGDIPSFYDHQLLTYYPEDDLLEDENGEPVEDYRRIVGNCLESYSFEEGDRDPTMFVQNFEQDALYEIEFIF